MTKEKMGKGVKFERIRRITGYLVGTLDKWNDAKKAEEKDRVKHGESAFGFTQNEGSAFCGLVMGRESASLRLSWGCSDGRREKRIP